MAPYRIPQKNSPISLYQVQKGETLKRWYPQSPPQNDPCCNRKTCGCWVPPFYETPKKQSSGNVSIGTVEDFSRHVMCVLKLNVNC